ncbi:MAG: glycine dehydrogenase (aminomethyl-transferring) [spirochete symbiont of Stewartia floridana]|nr:MAG: glycine dehydrogenase (aminomethyl-transferring) [spirochete symbiont of Stewartia floridana]
MFAYLPQSDEEIRRMLADIGVDSIDDLFSDIPVDLRLKKPLDLQKAKAEYEVQQRLSALAQANKVRTLFAGAGQYDHIIPAAVNYLAGRAEFVTAYTPYQPELSQGILQALFEFQSCIAEITGLPVSNASLYDGFTAAAEACVMALNSRRNSHVLLIAGTVHPYTLMVLHSFFGDLDVDIHIMAEAGGRVELSALKRMIKEHGENLACVLVQTPNIYGALENLTGWADAVHEAGGRLIISAHPLSLGHLASPKDWGADIAVGDTQSLGLPPYFGGPSAGYIACEEDLMRRMPGRIVGESVDADGKRCFVLTLQAREQHIKRERATSNICSNQALAAVANTVYLALLGAKGFAEVSRLNINGSETLRLKLCRELGLSEYGGGPYFNEFTLEIPVERRRWDAVFEKHDFVSGVWLSDLNESFPKNLLAVAVTEKRSREELDRYTEYAAEALR